MAITRVTLFKIPDAEHREQLLSMYKSMQKDAVKDGKPYILSVRAGSTFDDQRRQGFTLAVVTEFASEDDMKYYDNSCQAHARLKSVAKDVHQGMMMTYFEPIALA